MSGLISLLAGVAVGLALASVPPSFGDTSITDPVVLGVIWFVRPGAGTWISLVAAAIFLGIGALASLGQRASREFEPMPALVGVVGANGAATLLENAYGAGVMGVGWWLIGSIVSAALMWAGVRLTRAVLARLPS